MAARKKQIYKSPRTNEALEFIRGFVRLRKRFPRNDEIAQHMGWKHDTSATDCLMRLVAQGHIIRHEESRRYTHRRYRYELRE